MQATNNNLGAKQSSAFKDIDKRAAEWTGTAQKKVDAAADQRVREVLAGGWKEFQDKLREFDIQITKETKQLGALEDQQKELDSRQTTVKRALDAYQKPERGFIGQLAIYTDRAIAWVWIGLFTMGALLVINLAFLGNLAYRKIRG